MSAGDPTGQVGAQAALAGVRVLEVGAFMAGPFATMQLADLGAEVVKIERPDGGDPTRAIGPFVEGESSPFVRLNRNKRSVVLDLKSAAGREALLRLVETADVVVENLRPGAMTSLGLGYDALSRLNPRLVYVSASGWGHDGPLSQLAGLDIMAQARAGLMSVTGMPDGDPVKVGVPICDLVCGLYGAMGALSALRERDRSGRGQHVDVSLFESGVSFAIWEAGKYFATGEIGRPLGSAHQSTAPYQALRCADGWVTVGAVTPKTWTAFCVTLGLDRLLLEPRYADAFERHALRHELIPVLEEATGTRTVDDVVAALEPVGVPVAPIADFGQVFTDDHLAAREYFWDAPHPRLGSVRQLGSPMRFSRTPAVRGAAGPVLGADTRDVLASAGYSADDVERLLADGAAVDARPMTVPTSEGEAQ